MKNAKIGAKKDNITEKRYFQWIFFMKLLINEFHLYANRIQLLKMNSVHPLLVENPPKSRN